MSVVAHAGGGVSGGGEASVLRTPMLRIIREFVQEKSLSARPAPTRCHLWVTFFLPEGRRGYPPSASLCARGNPRASVLVRAAAGALLLQGAAWYSTIWR